MADSKMAPPIPDGIIVPRDYIAVCCQFCHSWSTSLPFYELLGSDRAWLPFQVWGAGNQDHPVGQTCRICINVHVAGGWSIEVGTLKDCKRFFLKNPLRLN
eukprot:TRINITY_DN32968_c0_g1_i1.p2 TRINITY_DN32968_c0_g1~~TRINITY_DN32968_c0_g1_i1.p2  ORF type:complete len:101 (+),score=4.54 TRINITY_DN32968_c0_g1_i1:181-483(+)